MCQALMAATFGLLGEDSPPIWVTSASGRKNKGPTCSSKRRQMSSSSWYKKIFASNPPTFSKADRRTSNAAPDNIGTCRSVSASILRNHFLRGSNTLDRFSNPLPDFWVNAGLNAEAVLCRSAPASNFSKLPFNKRASGFKNNKNSVSTPAAPWLHPTPNPTFWSFRMSLAFLSCASRSSSSKSSEPLSTNTMGTPSGTDASI